MWVPTFNASMTLVLLSGSIKQVEIFPSQYGKAQIAKESEKGPEIGPAGDEENENGKEYSTEALRKYQV